MSITEITINKDEQDRPMGYVCAAHVGDGPKDISDETAMVISSYYDFEYDCSSPQSPPSPDAPAEIASQLTQRLATSFRLIPKGDACWKGVYPLWMIGLDAGPDDSFVDNFECTKLKPASGRCCAVVHAPMTFWWAEDDILETNVMKLLEDEFNDESLTADANYKIQYIGAFIEPPVGQEDDGRDNVPPAISNPDPPTQPKSQPKGANFTVIGGVVLGGLLAVFLAAVFLLVRRKRRLNKAKAIDEAVAKSEGLDLDDGQGSGGVTLEIDVMSDDAPPNNLRSSFDNIEDNDFDNLTPHSQSDYPTPNSYRFDLAHSFKNDVMGTYGSNSDYAPTSMAVVPPYPMEETSDSEVDSWAQTDGTVGSLEERLEEITAEI